MNAAGAAEDLGAGTQQEVIGIGEQNLGAGFFERARQLCLNRRLRADRHEERCPHFVMQGAKEGGPGARAGGLGFDAEVETGRRHRMMLKISLRSFPRRASYAERELGDIARGWEQAEVPSAV